MTSVTSNCHRIIAIVVLVVVTLPVVWLGIVYAIMLTAARTNWAEREMDIAKWPVAFQEIATTNPNASIEFYEIKNGLGIGGEQRGFGRIVGSAPVRQFIELCHLEETDSNHPRAMEFDNARQMVDRRIEIDGRSWLMSPGFGTVHKEVEDLYLMQTSEDNTEAILYYYWTF